MELDDYKPSFKTNFILSIIIQMICYLSPLVVSPYLTRVLGAENIGIYSFSYSYAHYFLLFASFGFTNFGTMVISENRANFERRNELFWNLFICRFFLTVFCLLVYIILVFTGAFIGITDKKIMLVFTLLIFSTCLDFTFFFRGIEKLNIVSFGTAVVNLFYVASIFIFVKSGNDLLLFTFIKTICTAMVNMFLVIFIPKRVGKPRICKGDLKRVISGSLAFFLPTLVMGISATLDQTFLGIFADNVEVAYYQQSNKITSLLSAVLYAASTIVLSRTALLSREEDNERIQELTAKSIVACFFILAPVVVGLYLIGDIFIPLYLGDEFKPAVSVFFWLLPVAIASSFSSVVISAYYYPLRKTYRLTILILISIIINIILTITLLLLTNLGACAAAIGSLCAELFTTIVLFYGARSIIKFRLIIFDILKISLACALMFAVSYILNITYFKDNFSSIMVMIFDIIISALIYGIALLALKERTMYMGLGIFKDFIIKHKK